MASAQFIQGCSYTRGQGNSSSDRRNGACSAPTIAYAFMNTQAHEGRAPCRDRGSINSAMWIVRLTGSEGIRWAKCTRSPMNRRGPGSRRYLPIGSCIHAPRFRRFPPLPGNGQAAYNTQVSLKSPRVSVRPCQREGLPCMITEATVRRGPTEPAQVFVHLLPSLIPPGALRGGVAVVVDVLRATTVMV